MKAQPQHKLGEYFRLKHGYAFKGEYFSDSGPYVLLTPGNFHDEGGFKLKGGKEKYYTGTFPAGFILEKDSLIVAMTEQAEGLLGSSAWIPESNKFLHNQRLGLVTDLDKNKMDKKFLYYLFNTSNVRAQIRATANGAKVRHTSPTRIYEVEAHIPPLPTQRRIASILSAYDDLIENNTRRIAVLEEMARRIYEEWFCRDQNTQFSDKSIDDTCEVTDYVANGSFASLKSNVTYNDSKDYAILIRTTDYNKNWTGPFVYVAENSYKFLRKSSLNPGDIVIGNVGNTGTTFRAPGLKSPMTLGPNAILVKPHMFDEYIYHFIKSDMGQSLIRGITSGSAQPKFNKTEFRKLRIPMPAHDILEKFCNIASSLWMFSERLRQKNANLRAQRDLLLPKLISGEIDVSSLPLPGADDEAA